MDLSGSMLGRRIKMAEENIPEDIRRSQQGKECIPKGEFRYEFPVEELDGLIFEHLKASGSFSHCRLFEDGCKEGGTRRIYRALWNGTDSRQGIEVILKADLPDSMIRSDNARRHLSRGYNTEADIANLMRLNHVVFPIIRYISKVVGSTGEEVPFFAEDFLEDSKSLQGFVCGDSAKGIPNRTLNYFEFKNVFSQILDGLSYLVQMGFYHRDLKPSNILISPAGEFEKVDGRFDVRITDLANAGWTVDNTKKSLPTSGGRFITDPFLFEDFTGKQNFYDDRSEIYSLGNDMYFALTGKYIFESDLKNGRVIALNNGKPESVLDSNGRIDGIKFKNAIKRGLAEAKIKRPYADIIEICLMAPLTYEYGNRPDKRVISDFLTPGELIFDLRRYLDSIEEQNPRYENNIIIPVRRSLGPFSEIGRLLQAEKIEALKSGGTHY